MGRAAGPILAVCLAVLTVSCEADDPGPYRGPVPERSAGDIAPALLDPGSAAMKRRAPDVFRVRFETSRGVFVVETYRDWSPLGVDRFYNLARHGYFDRNRFFRVIPRWVAQFGLHGKPHVLARWVEATIPDEPVKHPNEKGTIAFATAGPNTRTTQLFINLVDNREKLDPRGFSPLGKVVVGMDVVESLYSGYGEGPPEGRGPNQEKIQFGGNAYLAREFPKLDLIRRAIVLE
jgi:peptidyl-prolyl cis-trans isomerase A (cyclophilin A)